MIWGVTRAALLALVWLFDADDDITELAWSWSQDLLGGRSPWHDVAVAYPPLAMFGFALPGVVAPGPEAYAIPFAVLMLGVDWLGARLGGVRYVLLAPLAGPVLLLWRYDLAPAVCHLAALTAALKGRQRASWCWLGIGIALKPYLLVVVPLWLMWDPSWRRALLAAAPSAVAAAVMTLLVGTGWVDAYLFQGSRELSVEAGPAVLASVLGVGSVALDPACLCWVRADAAGFGTAGTALALAGLALVYRRCRDLVRGSVCAVALVLLLAPVFSPQYLVWLVPVVLLGGRALWLAGAAMLTGSLAYPLFYDEVLSGAADPLLALRLLLLAALIVVAKAPQGGEFRLAGAYKAHDEESVARLQLGGEAARGGGGVADAGRAAIVTERDRLGHPSAGADFSRRLRDRGPD